MGKKTPKPFEPASREPRGSGEGLGWDSYPGIKRQRPRWRLRTKREDPRGPASRGLCAQNWGSAAPAPGFTPSAGSLWGSPLRGQASWGGLEACRGGLPWNPFPSEVFKLSAGLVLGTDWSHVASINQRCLPPDGARNSWTGCFPGMVKR